MFQPKKMDLIVSFDEAERRLALQQLEDEIEYLSPSLDKLNSRISGSMLEVTAQPRMSLETSVNVYKAEINALTFLVQADICAKSGDVSHASHLVRCAQSLIETSASKLFNAEYSCEVINPFQDYRLKKWFNLAWESNQAELNSIS